MALDVLAGPGCAAVKAQTIATLKRGRDGFLELDRTAMYRALGGTATSPASDPELYRVASYMLSAAVRFAREKGLDGVVTTSNGSRSRLNALVSEAGGRLLVTAPSRAEVCRRLRRVVPEAARREVCEEGLDRWYGAYQPEPGDVQL